MLTVFRSGKLNPTESRYTILSTSLDKLCSLRVVQNVEIRSRQVWLDVSGCGADALSPLDCILGPTCQYNLLLGWQVRQQCLLTDTKGVTGIHVLLKRKLVGKLLCRCYDPRVDSQREIRQRDAHRPRGSMRRGNILPSCIVAICRTREGLVLSPDVNRLGHSRKCILLPYECMAEGRSNLDHCPQ